MDLLELTLETPAENLALDEALLLAADEANEPQETLRVWEPREPFVVLGSSSRIADEVRLTDCKARRVAVLRRTSGGAAIVTGPGCLMYALVLSLEARPELRSIDRAHCFVLNHLARAIGTLAAGIAVRGTSDLAIGDRKFSGNSLRMKRAHLLYHGTLLYGFPLELIGDMPRPSAARAGVSGGPPASRLHHQLAAGFAGAATGRDRRLSPNSFGRRLAAEANSAARRRKIRSRRLDRAF